MNAVQYGSEGMGMDSPAEWDKLFEVLNDYYRNPTPTNVAYQVNPAVELGRTERVSLNNVSDVPMSGLNEHEVVPDDYKEVYDYLAKFSVNMLDDILFSGRKFFDKLARYESIMSTGKKPHRNSVKELRAAHTSMMKDMRRNFVEVENRRKELNMTRDSKDQINWDLAAESAEPTEKIHVSDAPPVPKTLRQALDSIFAKYWMRAALIEMESLRDKEVYDVVDLPIGKRSINSKWLFDYKIDPYGFIKKFKGRLVAVGCGQRKFEEYTDTHFPVVKIKTIRILMAMTAIFGLHLEQVDIETAYLYGSLKETNYMKLPQGFQEYNSEGKPMVELLKRSIYGLHQSGREWYFTIRDYFKSVGMRQLKSDPCAFLYNDPKTNKLVIILIYVDDITIASSDEECIARVKDLIKSRFKVKDLGEAQWLLKIQIQKFKEGYFMSQTNYTIQTLKEYDLWDIPESSWKDTPMSTTWEHRVESPILDEELTSTYASMVAKLLYLSTHTRVDLVFAVNKLSTFQKPARVCDMKALLRVMKYLRKTYDWGIFFQTSKSKDIIVFESVTDLNENRFQPEGYYPILAADASYGMESDKKSRSAYIFTVFGSVVTWYSKKQSVTALSSTEAELYALVEGIKEATWMKGFLEELGFSIEKPIETKQDNQSTIAIAINPVHHARVKHFEIKTHYIREKIEDEKLVKLVYCPTELMVADILTKALPKAQHYKLCKLMGMRSQSEITQGSIQSSLITRFRE